LAASGAAVMATNPTDALTKIPEQAMEGGLATDLPTRVLGKTMQKVSILGLGGEGALEEDGNPDLAREIINRAIDLGITYCDTARMYGPSEEYYGPVIATRRSEVFLASKTHYKTYDEAKRSIETTLTNLQTDHVDLMQIHNLGGKSDIERRFDPDNGSLKAIIEAKEQGMVKNIGATCHKHPEVIAAALNAYPFDTVLIPTNAADVHFHSFLADSAPLANQRNVGIIGMKIVARGRLIRDGVADSIAQLLRYAVSQPITTAIVGFDSVAQLEEAVDVVRDFVPMPEEEQTALTERTASVARESNWFKRSVS
jgi:aryl-alcohol dehydrogenase-like predicted oxidoreductase